MNEIRYVGAWTSTNLRAEPKKSSDAVAQCLWGDWVRLLSETPSGGWYPVRVRGCSGFLPEQDLTAERPLEVNFVDIGQGDGTFVVTPDDRQILVDAGERDNMHRFLRWRFNLRKEGNRCKFQAAIVTHPDKDHYKGFQKLFDDERFTFETVFHNGIVERTGDDSLGPVIDHDGQRYLTDVVEDRQRLHELLRVKKNRGSKQYPKLLWTALNQGRVGDIRMLQAGDEVFPARQVHGKRLSMKVLAPVPEKLNGSKVLRWFGSKSKPGKTKNGHSIVTLLQYGKVRILLGGDLNIPAERYLLEHYGHDTEAFRVDIAKACHHGSADFSTEFLDRILAHATVISSGDDESHGHPRSDTLGTIGKHSRGDRSLIFSTELARSAPERFVNARQIRERFLKFADDMAAAGGEKREKVRRAFQAQLSRQIRRSVTVFGMITLRTDGDRVLMAQRLEKPTVTKRSIRKWDLYPMEQTDGVLTFTSKHAGH